MNNSLITRALRALAVGVITGLLAALIIVIVSALLPGVTIEASFWGAVLGLVAGILSFLGDNRIFR